MKLPSPMLFNNVNIEAFSYAVPPETITSDAIELQLAPVYRRLKLPFGRLEMMSGIRERRLWPRGYMPSDAAFLAGEKALAASGLPKDSISCVINCSVCRDFLEPATATVVHHRLGLSERALVFDLSNACLGILTGMIVLAEMIENGHVEAGLLVAGENSRPLLESTIRAILEDTTINRQTIKPLFASLTIGSGAVAVVLAHKAISRGTHKLLGGATLSRTRYNNLCRGNADRGMVDNQETLMNTDSEMLMRRGVETAADTWNDFVAGLRVQADDFSLFCTHQVGTAHRRLLFETLGLSPKKDFPILEKNGNVGSVSCPMAFAVALEEGKMPSGGLAALLGIGSGINCTMLGVKW